MAVRQAYPDETADGVEAQHGGAGGVRGAGAGFARLNFKPAPYDVILMGFVTVFTLVSVSLYLVEWVRHMSTIEAR